MLFSLNDLALAVTIAGSALKANRHPLQYVAIRDGFMWATEGYRVIKAPVLEVPEEAMGQTMLIHHKDLKAILKRKPRKVQGIKFLELSEADFTIDEKINYPNCAQFFADQGGFESVNDVKFQTAFFGLLHGPSLEVVEFAPSPQGLCAAFHEAKQSTYPTHLGSQGIAKTLANPIAFRVDSLDDLSAFPFDSAKFVEAKSFAMLRLRHSDGHEVLVMAAELSEEVRHPLFKWPANH
jgi:hypothetical protein